MAQDPWKRAHQIKRLRDQQAAGSSPPPGGVSRGSGSMIPGRRSGGPAAARWVIVLVLIAGGVAAWYYRDGWLPRLRQQVIEEAPQPVKQAAEKIPEKQVQLDPELFDRGFGFGLSLGSDYLEMLAAMREHDPGWKVISTGGNNARLTAPGAEVGVVDGVVQTYELQIEPIFKDPAWEPWLSGFKEAQLSPALTYTSLTGGGELPQGESKYELSGRSIRRSDGWISPVYILRFHDGYLRSIEMAMRFGVSDPELEPPGAPPVRPAPGERP